MGLARAPNGTKPPGQAGDGSAAKVYVVDDDELIRSSLRRLLATARLAMEQFGSGAEFLAQVEFAGPCCLILDFHMPGMNGLEVQAALKQRNVEIPIVFLTGSSDIPVAVAAMKQGAVDFVEKPFDNAVLLERVQHALERSRSWWLEKGLQREMQQRLQSLTARERSVFELVVTGKTNKEIARELGASYRTIEIHRRRVMEKMDAATLADLVRMRPGAPAPER